VPALPSATENVVNCIMTAVNDASGWETGSPIANWLILTVAFGALWVSNSQRKKSATHMDDLLKQSSAEHKEQMDENYRAVQAQLDASREATRADLEERRNAGELDMTADFVSALDRLQITAAMDASEEVRGLAMHQAAIDTTAAASRFHLFVGHSRALMQFHQIFISMLQSFAPATMKDFESRDFDRLAKMQTTLRSEIVDFQKNR
jgi:hypothetical protein